MYANLLVRRPVLSALATAIASWLCTLVILHPVLWPYFSWIMGSVEYFQGISRGIAPFIKGGCESLANARGAASVIMLAFGAAVVASALVSCIEAHSARGKPIDDRKSDPNDDPLAWTSFRQILRFVGFVLSLLVSGGTIIYFWLAGGEHWASAVASCTATTPLRQAAYVSIFGFVALAPLLALLRRVYRFIYEVSRFRRA